MTEDAMIERINEIKRELRIETTPITRAELQIELRKLASDLNNLQYDNR